MCGLRILLAGLAQNITIWAAGVGAVAAISRAALQAYRLVPVIATCAHAGPRLVRNPILR